VKDYGKTVLFGSGYTVDETTVAPGWDFVDVNCAASSGVTPTINGSLVTFDINADTDVLDCTYTNRARGKIIVEKITDDGFGSFEFTSNTLSPSPFTLTTTAAGAGGKDSREFGNLNPGTYDVSETVPTGWNLVSETCSDGSDPQSIGLSGGETVTCTFHDARERGAILITKLRKHAGGGSGDQAHPNVTFTVTGNGLSQGITTSTGSDGTVCVDNLLVSALPGVGDYTVTETLPSGYVNDGPLSQTATVIEGTCASSDKASVTFHNTPLTDITVSVNSQVDDGTFSTMSCVDSDDNVVASGVTNNASDGDGSATAEDLVPGTYTCTVVVDP
jgi:hypothetical protein